MKFVTLLVSIVSVFASISALAESHQFLDDPATALLVIDVQEFYFPDGGVPLVDPEQASANAGSLLSCFRERGRLVIHVGHIVAAGGAFHQDVKPIVGEKVIMKSEVNSFLGTDLLEFLRESDIKQLVICGMQTHMCLEGATRAASDLGFSCVVIGDACATRSLSVGESSVTAEEVHNSTLATLKGTYAEVIRTAEFLGEN